MGGVSCLARVVIATTCFVLRLLALSFGHELFIPSQIIVQWPVLHEGSSASRRTASLLLMSLLGVVLVFQPLLLGVKRGQTNIGLFIAASSIIKL